MFDATLPTHTGVKFVSINRVRPLRHAFGTWCGVLADRGSVFLALFLPIVFNPYAGSPFEPTKVTFFRWTAAGMGIAFLLHRNLTMESPARPVASPPRRSETLPVISVLGYGAAEILATILSVDKNQSLWGFGPDRHGAITTLTLLGVFFIARWSLDAEEQRERLTSAMIVGSVPVTLYGIVQLLGLDPLSWTTDSVSPVHSTMGRSNFLGAYLAMVIPFVLARMVREVEASSKRSHPLPSLFPLIVLAFFQVTTLLATEARAAWLALTGAVVVFSAATAWRRRRRTYLWLCAAALLFGIGLLPVLNRVDLIRAAELSSAHREVDQTFASMRAHTIESRFRIWKSTVSLVPERWLFGYGPETFPGVLAERYPSLAFPASGNVRLTDPHNVLFSILFATGTLGLAAFLASVGAFFVVTIDHMRSAGTVEQSATLAAMVAYLIHSQFNPDVIVLSVFFWMLMAMGLPNSNSNLTHHASTRLRPICRPGLAVVAARGVDVHEDQHRSDASNSPGEPGMPCRLATSPRPAKAEVEPTM